MATQGKLIICPTPLGNLDDMTKRALTALNQCETVCCEDTRVTGKLLAALDIKKHLERLDEATITKAAPHIINRVLNGEVIAYCSDAGMPGVSDPGQRLIDAAFDAGACVEVLPGGTAVATAYVASGFTSQNFYFGSFFPRKEGERTRVLESLKALDAVLVFYESPQRIVSATRFVAEVFPHRRVAVCRELTKIHEEVFRGASAKVAEEFARREEQGSIRGEIVMVIDSPSALEQEEESQNTETSAVERARELLEGGMRKKEVARTLTEEFSLARNKAYEIALSVNKVC